MEDSFLKALAEGGYQVEALARCYFPEGIFVTAQNASSFEDRQVEHQLKKRMADLQQIINNRAKYNDTLFGLCAHTLFNQCKGKLLGNTLAYEDEKNQLEADFNN
jgi:hypothetical protein